ncbi:MAG TPA: hypothetical protein VFE62_08695 [Gemmataceae bacterium]|nr:hypothetical protein [Gemmataceae bacterium]
MAFIWRYHIRGVSLRAMWMLVKRHYRRLGGLAHVIARDNRIPLRWAFGLA